MTAAGFHRSPRDLPKPHLHLHLDGSFPRAWVAGLAARRGIQLSLPASFESTDQFFGRYLEIPALIRSLDELADGCRALVESEAANGVVYLEPGVEPQLYVPRLGSLDEVFSAMWEGVQEGSRATGIEVGCLVGVNTDFPVEDAEPVADLAARKAGDGVVAFGTAGFVEPAGLHRFHRVVEQARLAGLVVVCHAGQTGGPESVVEALDELRPSRIAHGINAARDPAVLRRLAGEGVVCDVALTSNVRLGVAVSYETHPFPRMLQAGVPLTLNADDELWFGSSIVKEFELARDQYGLTDEQLGRIATSALHATGASQSTVERWHGGAKAWLGATADRSDVWNDR